MRRTDVEFKKEVLDRSDRYIKMRGARVRRIMTAASAAAAACIIGAVIWGSGIGVGKKTTIPDGVTQNPIVQECGIDNSTGDISGENANEKGSAIVSVEVKIQVGERVISRCYSSGDKISQVAAVLQVIDSQKEHQEAKIEEIKEAIKKAEEQINLNNDSKIYIITVTKGDGTVKNYEITDVDGRYYEVQQKFEVLQQHIDRLQKAIDTMPTD